MKKQTKKMLSIVFCIVLIVAMLSLIQEDFILQYVNDDGYLTTETYHRLDDYTERVKELQEDGIVVY